MRTCVRMGISGTDHAEFRRALASGDWGSAFAAAHAMPAVELEEALELVLLGARKVDKDRYERLALRWLVRLMEERRISLHEASWVADRLRDTREGRAGEAGPALRSYIRTG